MDSNTVPPNEWMLITNQNERSKPPKLNRASIACRRFAYSLPRLFRAKLTLHELSGVADFGANVYTRGQRLLAPDAAMQVQQKQQSGL
jgi:hypothetical protein